MNKLLSIIMVLFVITVISGLAVSTYGISNTNSEFESTIGYCAANDSAMTNLTNEITTLLTDIIPVFVILGVFGAVIAYVGKMTKGFGG